MKIIAAADIHLGRPPSRVPAEWVEEFSPRRAWEKLVGFSVANKVDALLLAGDIVDRDNRYFESYGALRRGLDQLLEAGIAVVAVAGNHDIEVLPELHRALGHDSFSLLGEGGFWEHHDLECADGRTLRVMGYSFPARHCTTSPLASFPGVAEDAPANVIGLLHGDLDQANSQYAPVSRHDLTDSGIPLWILGHIHVPTPIKSQTGILYPGSLQALDPAETGWHGALLIDYGDDVTPKIARVTPAPLCYERIELDDPGRIQDRAGLLQTIEEKVRDCSSADVADAMLVDLSIAGESVCSAHELKEMFGELAEAVEYIAEVRVLFRKLEIDVRPPLELGDLATGTDLVAVLAELLLELEREDSYGALAQSLLDEATDRVGVVCNAGPLAAVPLAVDDRTALARDQLLSQGNELLRTLHRQREGHDA